MDELRVFTIYEPKRREIAAAPFRDRVVHHALCRILGPVLERSFIARSFSCQLGKGTTAARECCRRLTNQHRYVLKCDVRKFFPSIDHGGLLEKLSSRIACSGALAVADRIVRSFSTKLSMLSAWFPGDDLVTGSRPCGLPIGNLKSQLWGNFFLDDLDHEIADQQGHGAYLRYTDDFLLFGNEKKRLWELRSVILEQLALVRLRLAEPKSRMLATGEGIPFCGFRFLPGKAPRVLGATKRRFERRRNGLMKLQNYQAVGQLVRAWYSFSSEGNSVGLRKSYNRKLRHQRH